MASRNLCSRFLVKYGIPRPTLRASVLRFILRDANTPLFLRKRISGVAMLASFGVATTSFCYADAGEVQETSSGVLFSKSEEGLPLVGTGCRFKFGFVKIYALGVYCDVKNCTAANPTDESFWRDLVEGDGRKTIVIKMIRTVTPDQFITALQDAFKPRLQMPGRSMARMDEFRDKLGDMSAGTFKEGEVFVFTCDAKGLTVSKRGGGLHVIDDPDLSWACLDTYLGAVLPEVAPTLKKSIQSQLS